MEIKAEANALLSQIRDYQSKIIASRSPDDTGVANTGIVAKGENFGSEMTRLLSETLSGVSELQQNSANLSNAYQAGEDVALTEVILEMQKSSLAFEATLQVRNKVLQAYEQIMNMPV